MAKPNVIKCVHGPGSIIADYTYYPILIFKWSGVAENKLFDHMFEARDEFALRGDPPWSHIYIQDISDAPPLTSTARKYVADKQSSDPQLSNLRALTIPIVPNPLIRGVMTAVVWMTGKEKLTTEFAGTLSEGIRKAITTLETWGVDVPPGLDPDKYTVPKEDVVYRNT